MFGIEHRKGVSVIGRETSMAGTLAHAVVLARSRALKLGADNIRVRDEEGNELGVFPIIGDRDEA